MFGVGPLLILLVLAVVIGGAVVLLVLDRRGDRRVALLETARAGRVRDAVNLAYQHLEISPVLADAVIESSRDVDYGSPATVKTTTERLLALARTHRSDEPDLAVILIDTLRRDAD